MLGSCFCLYKNNNNNNNNNKLQTKTVAPLQHVLFLCLYKGVETKSAAPSLFFDPPPKQPANKYFLQVVVVLVSLL